MHKREKNKKANPLLENQVRDWQKQICVFNSARIP